MFLLLLTLTATRMSKIIKCGGNDDSLVLKAEDDGDVLAVVFESSNGERFVSN